MGAYQALIDEILEEVHQSERHHILHEFPRIMHFVAEANQWPSVICYAVVTCES